MKKIILNFILFTTIILLFGCQKTYHTITFETQTDIIIEPIRFRDHLETIPEDPIREGYTFLGWFLSLCEDPVDFTNLPNENILVIAKWQINSYTVSYFNQANVKVRETTLPYGTPLVSPYSTQHFGYYLKGWLDMDLNAYDKMPAKDIELHETYAIKVFSLPVLSIQMDVPIESVNQDEYVDADLTLINLDETIAFENIKAELKGRGNGSWGYDQKSYRIKLDQKKAIFTDTKSKHYVLLSAGHDFSSLRSFMAFRLTKMVLNNLEYTSNDTLIEVFFNGTYHGVYQFMEQIRVDEGRVDIESEYGEMDTGYLIEYDSYASGNEGIDYFWVESLRYAFTVHSPEPDEWQEEVDETTYRNQIAYIKEYVTRVSNAILNYDWPTINALLDIDSVIDFYIIHELFKNTDTGWSSFYMYKKEEGKLFFGPIWDFDFTAGISRGDASYEGIYVGDTAQYYTDFTSSEWFIHLMQIDAFVQLVKVRYQAIYSAIENNILTLFEENALNLSSFNRDAQRWDWHANFQYDQEALETWLLNRNQWLYDWSLQE